MYPPTPRYIFLQPAPSTSTKLYLGPTSSIPLHLAHFNLHPALCNTSNIIRIGKFPQISAEKFKVVRFDWKLVYMVSWRCWFRIRTEIFEIPTRKLRFGHIWSGKVKNVRFTWTLPQTVSHGCWFLFRH